MNVLIKSVAENLFGKFLTVNRPRITRTFQWCLLWSHNHFQVIGFFFYKRQFLQCVRFLYYISKLSKILKMIFFPVRGSLFCSYLSDSDSQGQDRSKSSKTVENAIISAVKRTKKNGQWTASEDLESPTPSWNNIQHTRLPPIRRFGLVRFLEKFLSIFLN